MLRRCVRANRLCVSPERLAGLGLSRRPGAKKHLEMVRHKWRGARPGRGIALWDCRGCNHDQWPLLRPCSASAARLKGGLAWPRRGPGQANAGQDLCGARIPALESLWRGKSAPQPGHGCGLRLASPVKSGRALAPGLEVSQAMVGSSGPASDRFSSARICASNRSGELRSIMARMASNTGLSMRLGCSIPRAHCALNAHPRRACLVLAPTPKGGGGRRARPHRWCQGV